MAQQADLLHVSRSSLYYRPVPPSPREIAITPRIAERSTAHPFYGSRKIQVLLQPEFGTLARNTVRHYIQAMGIAAIYPGPNLSRRRLDHQGSPYLLRGVKASFPNHGWGIDIPYIRLRQGWMYLVAILDWYSRYGVSWALDDPLEMPFALDPVDQALAAAAPQIWTRDQGSHFTSPQYTQRLEDAGVHSSMDGRGRALDNVLTERLWRSIKYEEVYLHDYASPREARQGITRYLRLYNRNRPHQALD